MTTIDPQDVHAFWFADAADDPDAAAARQAWWFRSSAQTDAEIRERFAGAIEAALQGELAAWQDAPRPALALVILCDQLPRNAWRGTARAFATDPLALRTARAALAAGHAARLSPVEHSFLLLPFEHSEAIADQDECVRRFTALLADAAAAWRPMLEGYLAYAEQHRELIARFGRFPHRNRVLGRESTAAELAFLEGEARPSVRPERRPAARPRGPPATARRCRSPPTAPMPRTRRSSRPRNRPRPGRPGRR